MAVASLSVSRSSIVRLCITIKCFQLHPSVFHKGVEFTAYVALIQMFFYLGRKRFLQADFQFSFFSDKIGIVVVVNGVRFASSANERSQNIYE